MVSKILNEQIDEKFNKKDRSIRNWMGKNKIL